MIVSVHQPHFLPWLGYLNKALRSDTFIWLHTVQYRKNYFQNRTRIIDRAGEPRWLTLPVHAHLGMRIDQVTVAEPQWQKRVRQSLLQWYGSTPFFPRCWPAIEEAWSKASDSLEEINYRSFLALLALLGASSVQVRRAGDFSVTSEDPTDRLVELCLAAGARRYLAGKGGRNYLRVEAFEKAGIEIIWQAFDAEAVVYPQPVERFVPGLSVIDCLFNVGPEKTLELVRNAWSP